MTLPSLPIGSESLRLTRIQQEFKPQSNSAPHNISEYYRGGGNVEDIDETRSIPTSGVIRFSDFYGVKGPQPPENLELGPIGIFDPTNNLPYYKLTDQTYGTDWENQKDGYTELHTLKDSTYAATILVRGKSAIINIKDSDGRSPRMQLTTDRGPSDGYEVDLTGILPAGKWDIKVPKKITRFRFVATGAGGGGSAQKVEGSVQELRNRQNITNIVTHEAGYDGQDTRMAANNVSATIKGGKGGQLPQYGSSGNSGSDGEIIITPGPVLTSAWVLSHGEQVDPNPIPDPVLPEGASFTITENYQELNLSSWATSKGWDGKGTLMVTINAGVYVWSDNANVAALTIDGEYPGGLRLLNNGYIMGRGGDGGVYNEAGQKGGNAIRIESSKASTDLMFIENLNGAFILGGGGGGGAGKGGGDMTNGHQGGGGAGGGAVWHKDRSGIKHLGAGLGSAHTQVFQDSRTNFSPITLGPIQAGGHGSWGKYDKRAVTRLTMAGGRVVPEVGGTQNQVVHNFTIDNLSGGFATTSADYASGHWQFKDSEHFYWAVGGVNDQAGQDASEVGLGGAGGGWGADGGRGKKGKGNSTAGGGGGASISYKDSAPTMTFTGHGSAAGSFARIGGIRDLYNASSPSFHQYGYIRQET